LLVLTGSVAACSQDWDTLDPRLGGTSAQGGGGEGGGGEGGASGGQGGDGGARAMGGATTGGGGTGGVELGPFGPPQLVGVLSHPEDDDDPVFTADGLELYFNTKRSGLPNTEIWRSTRSASDVPWGIPELVPELGTLGSVGNEIAAPDGLTLWLNHNPGVGTGGEIYVARRMSRDEPWGSLALVAELNSANGDGTGAISSDGLLFIMDSNRPGGLGLSDLYFASRDAVTDPWDAPVLADGLSSGFEDNQAWMSGDGLVVFFDSDRTGGAGAHDIWMSSRPSLAEPFDNPVPVVELNTDLDDSDPWLSPDLRYIMFSRSTVDGPREIYEAFR
jgi:hypothetical protein